MLPWLGVGTKKIWLSWGKHWGHLIRMKHKTYLDHEMTCDVGWELCVCDPPLKSQPLPPLGTFCLSKVHCTRSSVHLFRKWCQQLYIGDTLKPWSINPQCWNWYFLHLHALPRAHNLQFWQARHKNRLENLYCCGTGSHVFRWHRWDTVWASGKTCTRKPHEMKWGPLTDMTMDFKHRKAPHISCPCKK